jgi:hypothetical protein
MASKVPRAVGLEVKLANDPLLLFDICKDIVGQVLWKLIPLPIKGTPRDPNMDKARTKGITGNENFS